MLTTSAPFRTVGVSAGVRPVLKARPSARNTPAVPKSTTTTNPTVPALLRLARRRLRAPRRWTRSPAPAGRGAASRILVLSWSSMLGMTVLLIVVLNERQGLRQMRAGFGELALHRALARVHLLRDLLGAEIDEVAEDGHLALAAWKIRQRAGEIDPIPAWLDRWRGHQPGAREPLDAEASQAAPRQVHGNRGDPSVECHDLLTALGPLPCPHDRLLDGVLGRRGGPRHQSDRADAARVPGPQ